MFFHEPKLPYRSGCQRNTVKTHGLSVTHQNVHTLHCLTRRPFHQIINHRHHHDGIAPLWLRHLQLTRIGAAHVARCRVATLREHHDCRLGGKAGLKQRLQIDVG